MMFLILITELISILLLVTVNADELMKMFNSSEYNRPFLFAHNYKTGGNNVMGLLDIFCGEYNLKCASSYSINDGHKNQTIYGFKNIYVLNHSRAIEYDIIGGHFVRYDFAKQYLDPNGKYLTFIFYRNPLDKSLSLYFHQKNIYKSNYKQTYDAWIHDSLYPNCTENVEGWPFTPMMNSSYFKDRYVPLITEDYTNSLKLLFTIMGYPLYDPPDYHSNSYEIHSRSENQMGKQYVSYEVIKRFETCEKGEYQQYFHAIHLYHEWKELVLGLKSY